MYTLKTQGQSGDRSLLWDIAFSQTPKFWLNAPQWMGKVYDPIKKYPDQFTNIIKRCNFIFMEHLVHTIAVIKYYVIYFPSTNMARVLFKSSPTLSSTGLCLKRTVRKQVNNHHVTIITVSSEPVLVALENYLASCGRVTSSSLWSRLQCAWIF